MWPFEVLLIPQRPSAYSTELTSNEITALAEVLKQVTIRFDNLFETSFPYSKGFYQAPYDGQSHLKWTLHAHFYLPLLRSARVRKLVVGYELLAMPQREITPEFVAERLCEALTTHFKQSRY